MASDVDSVGELYQTELNYKQKWVIKNLSSSCKHLANNNNNNKSNKIVSPIFCTPNEYVDLEWRLSLYPRGKSTVACSSAEDNNCNNSSKDDYMSIYVESLNDMKLTATIVLSVLNADGERVTQRTLTNKVFQPNVRSFGYRRFVPRDCNASNGNAENGALTILCEITLDASVIGACSEDLSSSDDSDDDDDENDDEDDEGSRRRLREASDDLERLFESGDFSDVAFVCSEGQKIPVHKSVLSARSPVFKAMFSHNYQVAEIKRHPQQSVVEVKDVKYECLRELLRFVYSGRVKNSDEIGGVQEDLLIAADKYQLESLKDVCQKRLRRTMTTKNAVEYLKLADACNADDLKKRAIEFVATNSEEIIDSQDLHLLGDLNRDVITELFRATVKKKSKQTSL